MPAPESVRLASSRRAPADADRAPLGLPPRGADDADQVATLIVVTVLKIVLNIVIFTALIAVESRATCDLRALMVV